MSIKVLIKFEGNLQGALEKSSKLAIPKSWSTKTVADVIGLFTKVCIPLCVFVCVLVYMCMSIHPSYMYIYMCVFVYACSSHRANLPPLSLLPSRRRTTSRAR